MKWFTKIFAILFLFAVAAPFLACVSACTQERLLPPQNLHIENDILYWDEVEGATSYTVFADNVEYSTNECKFDLSFLNSNPQNYKIEVLASKGGNTAYDSEWTKLEFNNQSWATMYDSMKFYLDSGTATYHVFIGKADDNGRIVVPDYYDGVPVTRLIIKYADPNLKTLVIPAGIRQINTHSENPIPNLTNFIVDEANPVYKTDGKFLLTKLDNKLVLGGTDGNIPQYVTGICEYAFAGRAITELHIPDSVTSIGRCAFLNCTNLTQVTIPNTVKAIGNSIFANCTSITEINFPTDNHIDGWKTAFSNCTSLKSVRLPQGILSLLGTFSGCTSLESVALPEGVEALDTTFQNCTSLAAIELPQSVKNLSCAFENTALTEVVIPQNVSNLDATFVNCKKLERVQLPQGIKELKGTFAGCSALKQVEIPHSVKKLYATFAGCTSIKQIDIPYGVEYIDMAFKGCTSLEQIVLPGSVHEVGESVFANCTSLQKAVIEEGATCGGAANLPGFFMFSNCVNLTEVLLPSTWDRIPTDFFKGCKKLEKLDLRYIRWISSTPWVFKGCESLKTIIAGMPITADHFESITLQTFYFVGTEEELKNYWSERLMQEFFEGMNSAGVAIYYLSLSMPEKAGNFWHFVNGEAVPW